MILAMDVSHGPPGSSFPSVAAVRTMHPIICSTDESNNFFALFTETSTGGRFEALAIDIEI